MADIPLDALVSGGGDGNLPSGTQAFTNFGAGSGTGALGSVQLQGIDVSSALTSVFSLSVKRHLTSVTVSGLNTTSGSLRIQILVDGVVIADNTEAASTRTNVNVLTAPISSIRCNTSVEMRVQKLLSTSINVTYSSLVIV
jgi:hypothetical protein